MRSTNVKTPITPMLVTSKQRATTQSVLTNVIATQDGRERASHVPTSISVHQLPVLTVEIAQSFRTARVSPAFATAQDTKASSATMILMNARLTTEGATLSPNALMYRDPAHVDHVQAVIQVLVMPAA